MKRRDLSLALLCALTALPAYAVGRLLLWMIGFFSTLCYGSADPSATGLGAWRIAIPVLGGLAVGLMARYGSKAIRGHGIPEAMDQVLTNQSRISAKVAWLKPLSSAVAIGTGGPFGAEGPIIATGGALGSLLGQWLPCGARERKLLLASGAAAGMCAVFGTPLAAVLLAMELLLFEFHPSSILAVGLACAVATGLRAVLAEAGPVFPMPDLAQPSGPALAAYALLGLPFGLLSVGVSRSLYWVEEAFEKLPLHWMFWPALAGIAVGLVGWWEPRTLGVGYANITGALTGAFAAKALLALAVLKFLSWCIALGSGTSGGTLAPLLTIGSGLGYAATAGLASLWPALGLDPRLGALCGMAALFSGCSGALMASIVFAFECTHEIPGVLPVMSACLIATAIAAWLHPHSIMTEKLARRGVNVPRNWGAPIH